MIEIKGKYAVFGSLEDGIGEAITTAILAAGGEVLGTYVAGQESKMESFSGKKASFFEVDHSDRKSLGGFCDSLDNSSLAGAVYSRMMFEMESLSDFDHNLWDKMLFENFSAPNFIVHALKPKLQDGASISVVTSTEGFTGSFGASAYASCKAAIHNLVKTHANNLGPRKIRINAIAPGWIGGVMDTDEIFKMSQAITPLARLGSPAEVANVCVFLLSGLSSFVNGTTIVVDGGYSNVDTISKFEFEAEHSS